MGSCDSQNSHSSAPAEVGSARRARIHRLPCATRPATLNSVLIALMAPEGQRLGQAELGELGVSDPCRAGPVLDFLGLVEESRPPTLGCGFLEARQKARDARDARPLREFLREQLLAGCRSVISKALEPEGLEDLGQTRLHPRNLNNLVNGLHAALRDDVRWEKQTANCLKALHDAVLNCDDPKRLLQQSAVRSATPTTLESLARRLGVKVEEVLPWAAPSNGAGAPAAAGRGPASGASPGPRIAPPGSTLIGLPDATGPALHAAGTFRIARRQDDRPVLAHVYFERPGGPDAGGWLDPLGPEHAAWFEQLALRLFDLADSLRRGATE